MDGSSDDGLKRRFHQLIVRARKDSVLFGVGSLLLTVLLVPLSGLVLYGAVAYLTRAAPRLDVFLAIYATLFLLCGYVQYRARISRTAVGENGWLGDPVLRRFGRRSRVGTYMLVGFSMPELGCVLAGLFGLLTVPSLIFHLFASLVETRHFHRSGEVERLAFDLMTAGQGRVPNERIDHV